MDTRHALKNNLEFQNALLNEKLFFSQDKKGAWWFHEMIHNGWGQSIRVDDFKLHTDTDFQNLVVFYNKELGHVMLLDGTVQITENNWLEYQEKLALATILPQYTDPALPLEILIIGGGDGGVATTILKLFPHISVTMVDIDAGVVDAAKKYFPEISTSLREGDPRFNLVIGDGVKFVADPANYKKFAAAIVDCTDPWEEGPAVKLFDITFHKNLKKCLTKNGVILQQSGTLEMQLEEVKQTVEMMKAVYKYPIVLPVNMLTYPGTMALVGGSDQNISVLDKTELQKRFSDTHHLDGKTHHFKPSSFIDSLNNLHPLHQAWLDKALKWQSFATTLHAFMPKANTNSTHIERKPLGRHSY